MSTIRANSITNSAGSGAPDFPNGLTSSTIPAANLTGDVAAARITGALNATGSAPIYACRAWVNFSTTSGVSVRASGNVSSITDNGAGNYTVNFTTAMPDANFAATCSAMSSDGLAGVRFNGIGATTASSVKVYMASDARAGATGPYFNVAVFR